MISRIGTIPVLDLAQAIVRTPEGRILWWSKGSERLYGWSAADAQNRISHELLQTTYPDSLPEIHAQLMESGEWTGELRHLRKDGEVVWVASHWTVQREVGAEAVVIVEINNDITERKRSEERLRIVVQSVPTGILVVDRHGLIGLSNTQTARMFGYPESELAGQPIEVLLPERYRANHHHFRNTFAAAPSSRMMGVGRELFARRKDGSEFPVEIGLSPIETSEGPMVLASVIDITERMTVENALRESEAPFKTLVESIPGIVFTTDPHGNITFTNAQFQAYTGLAAAQLLGDGWLRVLHPEDLHERAVMVSAVHAGERYQVEARFQRHDGVYRWHLCRGVPLQDKHGRIVSWFGACTDIEQQKRASAHLEEMVRARTAELQVALSEKTVLLREVHHRVKNNLAVIASLLGQQTRKVSDPAAIDALEDCERRVQAMALVHEQLYSTETLDRINFSKYIHELASELHRACLPDLPGVRLRVEADAVEIGVHMAIPCGLILNELVFNAFKYAFDGLSRGEVLIEFRELADGNLMLSVQDDGVGIPPHVNWRQATSLGLRIVQILSQQLGGMLEKTEGPGTGFRLNFPKVAR